MHYLSHPIYRTLPLRALIVCALRCAVRVQPLIQEHPFERTDSDSISVGRVNDIALRLCQLFCREGLNLGSRLHTILEENKWKRKQASAIEGETPTDPALACGDAVFTAATEAAFGNTAVPGVASSSVAKKVRERVIAAVEFAFEAVSRVDKDILAQMGRAVSVILLFLRP